MAYAQSDQENNNDGRKDGGAARILERYQSAAKAMRPALYDYWLTHAYLLGEQHLYLDTVRNTIATMPRDPDRVQVTINKMWPSSRAIIAKAVSRPLAFEVRPDAADDATIRAAHLAEAVLRDTVKSHDWEGIREDALWGAWKGGTAALCLDWDPDAGKAVGKNKEGRDTYTGDTVESALALPDFVVEPGVRSVRDARWWIKCLALPPDTVKEQYGLSKTPKPDASMATTPFQAKMVADHNRLGTDADVDLTRVLTYYERPNKGTPEGKVCVIVGDAIVDEAPWPFPFRDKLNLVVIRETRVPGRWSGESVCKIARPVQTAINQSWSSIIEHMKMCGNARLWIPQSMMDVVDSLTDAPGEFVPYPDGGAPGVWTAPPTMPDWWIKQPDVLSAQLDDILGYHDVSRGVAPTNSPESGLGISILVEQDSTPLGRLTKETALAWSEFSSMVLETYAEYVTETRKAVITHARGAAPETSKWRGKDLLGQTDAQVPVDAIMPRSKAQMMEVAKTAVEMGLITPGPGALEQYIKITEIGGAEDLVEALSPDIAKARRENYQMATGEAVVPAVFDDHALHSPEHKNFMKSAAWDSLTPDAQGVFIQHLQAHSTLSAEQLADSAVKAESHPLLASAVPTDSRPTIPVEALAAVGAPPMGDPMMDPAMGDPAMGPVTDAVSAQNPGIDPGLVESGL